MLYFDDNGNKEVAVKMKPQVALCMFAVLCLVLAWPEPAAGYAGQPRGPAVAGADTSNTLVDAQPGGPEETLDPHWMYDTGSHRVTAQVYETLLMRPREDPANWVPMLASDWKVLDGGERYRFHIRSGVPFHEGGSLQAHDVAYSFWRGMLQDRDGGPMWLLLGPLLGVYDIDDYPGDDAATCQAVKDAVTYDDAAGTVTFHLPQAFGPFLEVLGHSASVVLDQEWMAANGDWAGDCADWRDYHNPAPAGTILHDRMNGTGPFRFVHWTAEEVRLERFDGYWRGLWWGGGPAGPAALDAAVIRFVPDWTTRRDLLTSGQADLAYVPPAARSELDPYLWGIYDGYLDREPTLVEPVAGALRMFRDLPLGSQTALLFNYEINTDTNPYIGSGALDGAGIPPDFFTDIHVRKGFNYAMDWQTVINSAYNGEAVRSRGPIPAGTLGYSDAQPEYAYDLTLAGQELQQAWGGQLWNQGFSMTLAYYTGSLTRQRMAEVLAQNLEALNPNIEIEVVELSSDDYLAGRNSNRLPMYGGGWMEDYHHPSNWVQPFLHSQGTYMGFMRCPANLTDLFDPKIEACVQVADPAAAQTCYEEIQDLSYQNAMAMWGVQPVGRDYVRAEVRGYYANPALSVPYYYAFSKGLLPAAETVGGGGDKVTVTSRLGSNSTVSVRVAGDAIAQASTLLLTPDAAVAGNRPGGYRLAGLAFDIEVCPGGECVASYDFANLVPVTLKYADADIAGVLEDQLYLYTWDGAAWVDVVADCGWPPAAYERDLAANRLAVPLCHATRFALVGGTRGIYLPLVLRN